MIQQTPLSWYNSLPLDSTLIKMEELGLISDSNSHDGIVWGFLIILLFAIICLFIYHLRVLSTKVKIALVAFFTAFALVAAKTVTTIGTTNLNLIDRKEKIVFLFFIIVLCVSVIILIRQIILRCHSRYNNQRNSRFLKLLLSCAFVIWAIGLVVHFIALALCGNPSYWIELACRPIACSFIMFLSGIDSNLLDSIKHLPILKSCLTGVGLAALSCTFAFLIHLLYLRLSCYIHLFWVSLINRRKRLYIFWGINEQSTTLAENIVEVEKKKRIRAWYGLKKNNYRIIFIEEIINAGKDAELSGWNSVASLFVHRSETFRKTRDLHSLLAIANGEIETLGKNEEHPLEALGLKAVQSVIQKQKKDSETHFFLLSSNEKKNIKLAKIFKNDITLKCCPNTTIHCHARYNNINKVIEDQSFDEDIRINIVDSSRLCVDLLKRNKDWHPVNFVEVNSDGTVSSTFRALVLGFSEVGRDITKYLYEYSAFVDSEEKDTNTHRSPYVIDIVDEGLNKTVGKFWAQRPSVPFYEPKSFEDSQLNSINLHNWSVNSYEYQQFLIQNISDINYIVIALGNDEINMASAIDILNVAMRYRKNLDQFRIFIRTYSLDAEENLIHLEEYFNNLTQIERKGAKEDEKGAETPAPICIFGKISELYSYDIIVSNGIQKDAESYSFVYEQTTSENNRTQNIEEAVDFSMLGKIEQKGAATSTSPKSFSEIQSRRRKYQQNLENSLHKETKILLVQKALGPISTDNKILEKLESAIRKKKISRQRSTIVYKIEEAVSNVPAEVINNLLMVLAKTEHLRWNASHEMLGYEYNKEETIDLRFKHCCLCRWEDLKDDETRSYDCNVVDVTLGTDNQKVQEVSND